MQVDVTGGERIYAWARVAIAAGQTFTASQVTQSLTPIGGAHTWRTPDSVQQVDPATVRAALLVDTRFPPGAYRLWVKVTDTPEVEFLVATGGPITVL